MSIDIDGNDYWVWKTITNYDPRVVCIEYNSITDNSRDKTVKYDPRNSWSGKDDYYGATLGAMEKLFAEKKYKLIYISNFTNLFFIKENIAENLEILEFKRNGRIRDYPPSNKPWVFV